MFKEKINNEILKTIKTIRESFIGAELVFKNGSCYKFYEILKLIYPVKPYYADNHVVSEINGYYYDIAGEVKGNFIPFDENIFVYDEIVNNKFHGHIDCIQCPNCDEIIKIKP